VITVSLDQLRQLADDWLLRQKTNRPLPPDEEQFFRTRLCLPSWLIEAMKDADKEQTR
jgi:hypothetical protein